MGSPVKISVLCLILLIAKANSQSIVGTNPDVSVNVTVITNDNIRVVMLMDENNHDYDDENNVPHILLFEIRDVPDNNKPTIQFSQTSAYFTNSLEQDGTTFYLYANQSFDYEKNQRFYQFNVLVTGVTPTYYPLVSFSINNIDDEPPTLSPPQCKFDENTIYSVVTSDCYAIVSDPDGWLNLMTFPIDPNRDAAEDIFALEFRNPPPNDTEYTANVYVTVNKELDYQNVTFYLFDIRAKDGAGHSTTPNEVVRANIDVNDLPDTDPEWRTRLAFEQFEEQSEQTFNVYAIDGDRGRNDPINYEKLWEDDPEANYISIDENGEIDVKKIDRDKDDISTYNFAIRAFKRDYPSLSSTLNISFYIIDIDNNPPLIEWLIDGSSQNVSFDDPTDKVTSLSFLENYNGNLNLSIFVRDIDTGENAQFTVQLEDLPDSTEDYVAAFMIVPTAGYRNDTYQISVRNSTYLDYEVDEWVHIKFYVLTRGNDPSKEDRMLVDITLINYNDEIPIFELTDYTKSINETAKKGDFIIQIMATDRDAEDFILSHTLIGSTYTNRVLGIEEDTGRIYVNDDNAFDYDTVNPIFVQIRATDKGNNIATVPLTITLLDVNNKAPTISVGDLINVDENQFSGKPLNSSITATDMDTTAELTAEIDWALSYAMKNSRMLNRSDDAINQQIRFIDVDFHRVDETDDTNKDIKIDLIVNANNPDETTPDFELFDSLYIVLKVTDWNTDPEFINDRQNTSVTILISINDINDNTPYFPEADLPEEERQNRTVQEVAPLGVSVGSIVAIDLDVTDTVTYNCKPLDAKFDWLNIDPRTGAFTVKDSNIDADTYKTFYFYYSCTASDNNDTHTSEALTVPFYIIDTNNKVPSISIPSDVYVDEQSDPGTNVSVIETSDADRDIPFHTVACFFTHRNGSCYESFNIDNNNVTVKIGGNDLNRDEGLATYDCAVTCEDNPDRLQNNLIPHSVLASFTIHLRDINNNAPAVQTKELATTENTKKDDLIGIIVAKDIDEGDNAEIDFSIEKVVNAANQETVSNLFGIVVDDDDYRVNLTHKQAHLIALDDLEGKYGTYTVSILVEDRGTPPLPGHYDVTVEVEKFNFEAPRFIFPASDNQAIVLLTMQDPNTQLILFRSEDSKYLQNFYASDNLESDVCNKWDIQFSLIQTLPEENTIFKLAKIDACSSQLQINQVIDGDAVLGVTFNLLLTASVKNGEPQAGEAPYSVSRSIVINFLDNSQKPVFSDRSWTFKFYEEDDTQTIALANKATYEIEDDDSLPIFYYLITPNETISLLFAVDSNTGTVSLKAKLDYETDESFEFQIVASNDTSPTSNNPNSYLDVICNVIDINDNVPQWSRDVFFGAVMSGYIRNTPILTVQATDLDKIDQGKLTYVITGSIIGVGPSLVNVPNDAFLITETTGEIRLNFQVDNTMSGHFEFDVTVSDVVDPYGNGPHWNTTNVKVVIITDANTVIFRFLNTVEEVQNAEEEMLQVVTNVLGYEAYRQNIDKENQNGVDLDNQTFASLYFINNTNIQAIESETILRLVSNINIFSQLVGELRNETGLILLSFPSTGTTSDNLEDILRAWLVGVSVVLGALCLILLVTFILKTRELNNRITNLTMRKFGSQESGLNRLGISAPTTNKHAIEGSNPIFNISSDEIKRDLREFDEVSMRSGDSDLIGIEDSPEFDYRDNKLNNMGEYI